MNKVRNEKLIPIADRALRETGSDILDVQHGTIPDSYNGQVAALGVIITMSGLRPALAIYYQNNEQNSPYRKAVLEVIAKMITYDTENNFSFSNAKEMFRYAVRQDADLKRLRQEVIECSIALKQVIRTYNLVKQ